MKPLILESINGQVDHLLTRLCIELAISDTQHARATSAYSSLGEWLGADGSPLHIYDPRIFPQGSIPLGTTVKPRKREEFDADLVCVLQTKPHLVTPAGIYQSVLDRVMEHELYKTMVEPCERCVRLNYEHQFHLDIVPAVPSPIFSATAIVIPDATKTGWQTTDPEGFLRWFKSKQVVAVRALAEKRADVQPMPDNGDPEEKTTLQRAVQLWKRRRDVYFDGSDLAPKSILLTTLAGTHYGQELVSTDAVINLMDRLLAAAKNTADVPEVFNPSNPGENLARHWKEDPHAYRAFLAFCLDFREGMRRLLAQTDTVEIAAVLQELFDPADGGMVKRAVSAYTEEFQKARESGAVRMYKGGALTTTAAATSTLSIPKNNFFGA